MAQNTPKKSPHRYTSNGVTAESLGTRIRRMINTKIMEPLDGEQVFDDLPNEPTKSMEVNPIFDYHNDIFDLAEDMHYTAAEVSSQAENKPTSAGGQSETGGDAVTPSESEVND